LTFSNVTLNGTIEDGVFTTRRLEKGL